MYITKIMGSEPTRRTKKLREMFLDARPTMCCDRALVYTRIYQQNESMPAVLKRAIALKETLKTMPIFILEGELIAGHPGSLPRSAEVFPEINIKFMKDIECFETREYNKLFVSDEVKKKLYDMLPYWEGRTLTDALQYVRPEPVKKAIKSGLLSDPHEWSGLAHVAMDYRKMLEKGINGMLDEIRARRDALELTDPKYPEKSVFYKACEQVCEGTLIYAKRYRKLALEQAEQQSEPGRKKELLQMAEILDNIPANPAVNFREAIQSFWFMQLIPQIESNGFSITPGRFDTYMWPYLSDDLENGRITYNEAQELVDHVFLKCSEIMRVDSTEAAEVNAGYASGQNLSVGGIDENGNDVTNALSYICLRANHNICMHQPNFTVRLHKNTPKEFLSAVVESISCGNGMPQLLNDELIVPSLIKHGIPEPEARDYIAVGCDEITPHKAWSRCNGGYVNFSKLLEISMNNGKDMLNEEMIGLPLDSSECKTFEEFKAILDKQMDYAFQMQACEASLADYVHKNLASLPFVSVFVDDCLEKGRDVTDAGAHYNTTGVVGVGTASVADSLYAIKELVFSKNRKLDMPGFCRILKDNFSGNEALRQYIINKLPKFGNDNEDVDELAVYVTSRFFDAMESYKNYRGGDFWPALYSVSAQVGLGNYTAASADGRLANIPLSDGLTPMYGLDVKGPTASMNSITKVDLSRAPDGVIVNQRLVRSLFTSEENRGKVAQLLRYFVDKGGFHWQFNIVDNETLKKAQQNPDKYKGLVVRVAGYSAIFIELSNKAQNSIIARCASDIS